ncbi:hypothetical protein Ahy_A10g047158 [Arachis hypogaea]|uniref:Uncharacterized protein n=1 Tax=Arachis hypogaea TaxID=3818 RepID=A0A445B1R5_ARAHY|nr:hypothetical protein Ahy_A10g047158 [Arachis hypogaea]
MAEKSTLSPTSQTSSPLPRRRPSQRVQYLEVNCTSSGKTRRFAESTDAGSAVELINMRLKTEEVGLPSALYIEAVKDGEEPIVFGPTSTLVSYGDGWKLQTVTQTDLFRTGILLTGLKKSDIETFDGCQSRHLRFYGADGGYEHHMLTYMWCHGQILMCGAENKCEYETIGSVK